jgi:DNA-binding response OmpR family regulator
MIFEKSELLEFMSVASFCSKRELERDYGDYEENDARPFSSLLILCSSQNQYVSREKIARQTQHVCPDILSNTYKTCLDYTSSPLDNLQKHWFGSSIPKMEIISV